MISLIIRSKGSVMEFLEFFKYSIFENRDDLASSFTTS